MEYVLYAALVIIGFIGGYFSYPIASDFIDEDDEF